MKDFLMDILKNIFGSIWKLLSSIVIIVIIAVIAVIVFGYTENIISFVEFLKNYKI